LIHDIQDHTARQTYVEKCRTNTLSLTPGGSSLSCVAQSSLTCDNSVIERGKSLCRANAAGGGFFDGANIIQSLNQAKVN